MPNIIKPKRSNSAGVVPTTGNLVSGELGVNMADKKVYINNGTAVVQVGAGNLTGLADTNITTPANGQALTYDSASGKWINSSAGVGDVIGAASSTDNAIVRFDGTTGKIIQNSTVTIDDNGNFVNVNSIGFDTTPGTLPTTAGTMSWDDGDGVPSVILKGGNTTLQIGTQEYARVYNDSGTTLTKGQVVYISGAQGNRIAVKLARADVEATSFGTIGLVAESIANGAEGYIIVSGALYKLNTTGLTAGATVYLSPTTAGAITTTKPQAPNQLVVLGWVERVDNIVGSVYVKIDNGYELDELHDVQITSPQSGNLLIYDASTSPIGVWKNANLTDGTGITITEGAGSITIANSGVTSLTGTANEVEVSASTGAVTISLPATINANTTGSAATLTTGRTISATGDISYTSGAFDGSANVTGTATLATVNSNVGSFGSATAVGTFTVNAKGLITAASATTIAIPSSAITDKGLANGVASLDAGGKVPTSQLPSAVLSGVTYQGAWNASTNSPTLTSSVGTQGYYYVVSVAGTTNLNGITDWQIGDWAIYNGSVWQKVDNTDAVTSVNGSTGAVTISYSSLGTVPIANGGTNATDAATARSNLGLAIGTNVQAYDADLAAIAALTPTADNFIVGNGTTWILETPAQARTSLGATTLGSNLITITNPSAVTFPRFNADNTVSALDAATFRTAIGAGTGNGTVTSVTGTSPVASSGGATPAISLASGYGDTQNPYASKTANFFLAAPNGTAGVPTFRAIVAADIPTLNQNTTGTASNVTGIVAIANGGTGATTAPAANAALTGFTTTATAAGTTTLTNASSYYQVFTGTSNQTVQLPATSTLAQGWSYHIVNNSTGTLTLQTSTAVSLATIPSGVTVMATVLSTAGNTATDWEFGYTDFSSITGTGSVVLSTSPTLTTPNLGTPSAATLTNATGLPIVGGTTGTLSVGRGGTGLTTIAARSVFVANSLDTLTTVTPGAGQSIRINAGNTAWEAYTPSTGTVTSVGGTGTVSGLTLSGTVTTTGNLTLGGTLSVLPSNFASQTANFFLAAPNGTAGVPTFRAIVAADIPTLNQNTTGTASNVTGTVAIANGGTGATAAAGARTNLGATTLGANLFTITNPSAVTFPRFNADNTVSALDAATFRTAIGAGTSSTTGTVTSITAGTGLSGGTITTSGTIALANTAVTPGSYTNASITVDAQGRITAASSGSGSSGTVTSVSGTGTVSGLTLTGTVTTSGSLTLGGNLSITADMIYDIFNATASQTTFTTSQTYTSGKIEVYVNGVKMVNGSDVTVTSGTSIVFGTGLPVNTRVDAVYPI